LKFYDILLGGLLEVFLSVESLLGTLVEHYQVLNVRRVIEKVRELIIELSNQHAELCAPISQVVHAEDIMPKEF
jgi:hypothetical protein